MGIACARTAGEVEEEHTVADRRAALGAVRQAHTITRPPAERLCLEELTGRGRKPRPQQTQAPHVLLAGQEDKWNDHPGELAGRRSKEEGRIASVEADLNGLRGELSRAGQGVVDSELRMRELRETPPGRPELEPDLPAAFESESRGPGYTANARRGAAGKPMLRVVDAMSSGGFFEA